LQDIHAVSFGFFTESHRLSFETFFRNKT